MIGADTLDGAGPAVTFGVPPFVSASPTVMEDRRGGGACVTVAVGIGRHKAAVVPGEAGVDGPAVGYPVDRVLPGSRHVWDGWCGTGLCRIAVMGHGG